MQLGMVGLGRMGGNMTLRCLADGHQLVVYDQHDETVASYVAKGAVPARRRSMISSVNYIPLERCG